MNQQRRLVLVGGGHAHLEVLRRLAEAPFPGTEVLLISAYPQHHYSGMAPGYLAGIYSERDLAFDLGRLAARASAGFLCDRVQSVDLDGRRVTTAAHGDFSYEWVSFNIGSRAAGSDRPHVREHAQLVKPISRVVRLRERARRLAEQAARSRRPAVSIVGAGAGGVEVALALERLGRKHGAGLCVTVWESGPAILSGYPEALTNRAEAVLAERGIEVRTGVQVEEVREQEVRPATGAGVPADLTVWLTGPTAPPLFRESGLPVDERGFLLVDNHLRSVADPSMFGAGDCVTLEDHPLTPKAGVYAVREAPILWANLKAAIEGNRSPERYEPQGRFLSILNTCDGKALLDYHGWVAYSRWAWWLKDWIDRRFVRRYQ